MDFVIDFDGQQFVPGGDAEKRNDRINGSAKKYDWTWRWSEKAVCWGIKNKLIVKKGNRLYTKTYLFCRKATGKCQFEIIDPTKAYSTLRYLENTFSNDNGKKELDLIFNDSSTVFKNPKPSALIYKLIKMVCRKKDATILDFFAGSGTTGQAVMELNREDGGNRTFILCTNNETTELNPNGIAYDVTAKRLKRVMSGKCYDGTDDFPWIKNNKPYIDNLNVYEIAQVSKTAHEAGETAFDKIDETCYGLPKFEKLTDKIAWICINFENATKDIEKKEGE